MKNSLVSAVILQIVQIHPGLIPNPYWCINIHILCLEQGSSGRSLTPWRFCSAIFYFSPFLHLLQFVSLQSCNVQVVVPPLKYLPKLLEFYQITFPPCFVVFRKAVKATLVLLPLLGITYMLFFVNPGEDDISQIVFIYFNSFLQSFQVRMCLFLPIL